MYQPISSIDFGTLLLVLVSLLLLIGLALTKAGIQLQKRKVVFGGSIILFVLLPVTLVLGYPPAQKFQDETHSAMEHNILTKYEKDHASNYVRKVEFAGYPAKGVSGNYFTVTYRDFSTKKILFRFDSKTGEPCECSNRSADKR